MPVYRIEGSSDARLAPYFNLQSGKHAPESFIVESVRLVERLLNSHFTTHSVLIADHKLAQIQAVAPPDLPIYVGSKTEISDIAGFNMHRGCLAHASAPPTDLEAHLNTGLGKLTLVLEGLADPANVGSIIRNAAAFGASLVIADINAASPFTRKASRASAGHLFHVPIAMAQPKDAIEAIRGVESAVDIVATTGHRSAMPLEALEPVKHRVLVIGNEGHGVSEELRHMADSCRTIALSDGVDSLNAAAASALMLYIANNLDSKQP